MAFKADFKAVFTNNLTAQQRGEIMDGYIKYYSLTKPDGTPLSTVAEKADAVTDHFVTQLKHYRTIGQKQAAYDATNPADIPMD